LLPELEIQKIRTTYDLQNKFVVIFGGNIGKPQKMENIVALAKACEDIPDIFFFIVGGGNEKDNLEKQIVSEQLNNIKIQGYLSREAYFNVLQTAHVGLISLSEDFTIPNYPSKALVYLNAKVPILASVDLNTDFGRHMEEIDAGLWAEAGKTQELKEKLLLLYNDTELRKQMGENGYNYMKSNLLTSMASKKLIEKISNS
jgi:glycosyltransferase involved in cell wall biosynthesis